MPAKLLGQTCCNVSLRQMRLGPNSCIRSSRLNRVQCGRRREGRQAWLSLRSTPCASTAVAPSSASSCSSIWVASMIVLTAEQACWTMAERPQLEAPNNMSGRGLAALRLPCFRSARYHIASPKYKIRNYYKLLSRGETCSETCAHLLSESLSFASLASFCRICRRRLKLGNS